jgi:hypothetical protein
MRRACDRLGWAYRLVGEIDAVRVANLRWLAGYRHARYGESEGLNSAVTASFAVPAPLVAQAPPSAIPSRFSQWCSTCCGAGAWLPICPIRSATARW